MADPKIRIRATDETGPAFRTANANISGLADGAAKLVGALGGTLAVAGLANLVKGAIDAADELSKLSQRTGIAVETLGGLGFAASMAGGSMEGITDAADKLNKSLAEAASGQKLASEAFDVLGISATDAAGQTKSVDTAMAEIADKFATFKDGPEKAALAMRLFGKAGADQIVLLNAGGTALREQIEYYKRYSGVSEETSKRAEVFNDTLEKIGLLSTSLGNTLASSLLPSLQAVADAMLDLKESGSGFGVIGDALRVAFETIAIVGANVIFVFRVLAMEAEGAANKLLALGRLDITGFNAISKAVRADAARARSELDAFERRVMGIGSISPDDESAAERRRLGLSKPTGPKRSAPRLPSASTGSRGGASGAPRSEPISEAERALARYVDQLASTIEKTQDLSEQEKALNFLREIGTTGQVEQVRNLVLGMAQQIDAEKALAAATEDRIRIGREAAIFDGEQVAEANRARQERLNGLIDATPTAQLEKSRADIVLLTEEFQRFIDTAGRAGIDEQTYLEAVSERLGIAAEGYQKLSTFAEQAAKNIQDSIGQGLADILEGNFSDIGKNFTKMVNRLVAEAAAANITESLFGKGGNGSGLFGDVLGSFGRALFGGARASGGPVRGGTSYLVGEMGPELFTPQSSGQIIPNHALAGAAGAGNSVVVHINQSFAPGTSRQTTMQAAVDARRQLEYAGRNL